MKGERETIHNLNQGFLFCFVFYRKTDEMQFGKMCFSNISENALKSGENLIQQDKIHICLQTFEHKEKDKTFSGKKIFFMCEQVDTKEPCNKQRVNVGKIIQVEKKMFHKNRCGKHQKTQSRERLCGHFKRKNFLMYPTGVKISQISQTAKSHYKCSYCTKSFSCKSPLTSKQRTDTGEHFYVYNECKK